MKKASFLLAILLVAVLLGGCSNNFSSFNPVKDDVITYNPVNPSEGFNYDNLDYKNGEILVFAAPQVDLDKYLESEGSSVIKEWPRIGWALVEVPGGETEISFIDRLKDSREILLAEPNFIYELEQVPAVGRYDEQWGFKNINAEAAWDITTGSADVIVAVVDTGVDINHPEFGDKIFIGAHDVTGEGYGGANMDDNNGHGTHVAGIAADDGRSGQIAGVAWDCPIMPVKVMNNAGTIYTAYLIDAMLYLADYGELHTDKRVVANMSIGGRGYSYAFKDAIDAAAEEGVLLVTSAGNDHKRVLSFPSAYNGVVSVAASTPIDVKTDFSTTGPWNSVAAPGINILSSTPGGNYEFWDGTSMASPFVTGAAALLLSHNSSLSPMEIKNQLEQTARGSGFSEELGHGIVDLKAMLGAKQPMAYGGLRVETNLPPADPEVISGIGVITVYGETGLLQSFGTTGTGGEHHFHALKPGLYTVCLSYKDYYQDDNIIMSKENVPVTTCNTNTIDFDVPVPDSVNQTNIGSHDIEEVSGRKEIPLTVTSAGFFEMETTPYMYYCDTVIELLDSSDNVIASNDDFGASLYSRVGKNLTPGNYTIVVREWGGSALYCHLDVYKTEIVY